MQTINQIIEIAKRHHNWGILLVASVVLLSGIGSYVYHHNFDTRTILIAQSISVQKEKLESEKEMKELEKRISVYNSMAEEHNIRAKEVMSSLSEYIVKTKAQKTVKSEYLTYISMIISFIILTLILSWGYMSFQDRMEMSREIRKNFRTKFRKLKRVFGF